MTAIWERRQSRAAIWSRRLGLFSAVLLVTAVIGHRYRFLETPGFFWIQGLVGILALLSLALAGFAFLRMWNHGEAGGRKLAVGTLVSLIVLIPFGYAAYQANTTPALNDISTDLDDPPALSSAQRARTAEMNQIVPFTPAERNLQIVSYPGVVGRRYDLPFDATLAAVNDVISRQGWQLVGPIPVAIGQMEITIQAVASTLILAFPIDISIRITNEGETTYVDMRSASRYGRHDRGDNAARIESFLAELDAEIAGKTGAMPEE